MPSAEISVVERMQGFLRQWEQSGDNRAVFLGCYRLMTINMLEAIRRQEFNDPDWVERLLYRFADYYFDALAAYERERPAAPAVWRQTFQATCQPKASVLQSLLLGVNAHINYDLIFTLVDLLGEEWRWMTPQRRKSRYADHSYVNEVIYRTVDAVQDTIIEPRQPLMEVADRMFGPLDEWAIASLIRSWRDKVWQDAIALLEAEEPLERQRLCQEVEQEALRRGEWILAVLSEKRL